MSTLQIEIVPGAENVMVQFPFTSDVQFMSGEFEVDGRYFIEVALPDRSDTSAAMEQHLNTNPDVISYAII